jgi:SAM-dependent methyltransferase
MDSWEGIQSRIVGYYESLITQYGYSHRSCDYGSKQSQTKKFQALADALPTENITLLDVGCGFADFADFLSGCRPQCHYTGIDITAGMIEEARRLRPHVPLKKGNILNEDPGRFDYVSANGIFYLMGPGEESIQRMKALITRMFAIAARGVAFNSLSAWAARQEPNEFYAEPVRTLDFCRTLTPWVVLRHDYLPHDFSIYMYREARV